VTSPRTLSSGLSGPAGVSRGSVAALPRQQVRVKDHSGKELVYEGPLLRTILQRAGVPIGDHQMRGPNLSLYLTVEAADGYKAVFAIPELDDDFAERSILLADCRDGRPLDESEGPLRIIVPQEARPARSVKRVVSIRVQRD
jgi:Oxidoreductase molybdopterin binding domain